MEPYHVSLSIWNIYYWTLSHILQIQMLKLEWFGEVTMNIFF